MLEIFTLMTGPRAQLLLNSPLEDLGNLVNLRSFQDFFVSIVDTDQAAIDANQHDLGP